MPYIQRTLDKESLELQGTKTHKDKTWLDVWHPRLNHGVDLAQLPAHSSQKVYLIKLCDTHIAYQSLKSAVTSKNKSWLNCKICSRWYNRKHVPKATQPEHDAYVVLAGMSSLSAEEWFVDCRIILDKTKVGSIDVWIPKHELAIMIDGSSHFAHKYDMTKSQQRRIDDRFCVCAVKKVNVLRVHFNDVFNLANDIATVIERARVTAPQKVLYYTKSYYTRKYINQTHIDSILEQAAAVATDDAMDIGA